MHGLGPSQIHRVKVPEGSASVALLDLDAHFDPCAIVADQQGQIERPAVTRLAGQRPIGFQCKTSHIPMCGRIIDDLPDYRHRLGTLDAGNRCSGGGRPGRRGDSPTDSHTGGAPGPIVLGLKLLRIKRGPTRRVLTRRVLTNRGPGRGRTGRSAGHMTINRTGRDTIHGRTKLNPVTTRPFQDRSGRGTWRRRMRHRRC